MEELIPFELPKREPTIIKVVGVGGGGGNAVNHMYQEGIRDVSYLVCNTDKQVLDKSPVPDHLQLGKDGLGAGNDPEKARMYAEESVEDIREALGAETKMIFITAGLGGGTGTGASPVVARVAREMDILTVGIVTIPFRWEGQVKINQALRGLIEIQKHVDALLVINNDLLHKVYPKMDILDGFAKADDTLCIAAKSIAEIITVPGYINLDFADVRTVLKDGGNAVMSTGFGKGPERLNDALNNALNSPLLNNNNVESARKILFNIGFHPDHRVTMEEMDGINRFMDQFNHRVETVIWGMTIDESLDDELKVTLLASGYDLHQLQSVRTEQTPSKDLPEDIRVKLGILTNTHYGDGGRTIQFHPKVLTEQQLDDDALIEQMSEEPAFKRPKE